MDHSFSFITSLQYQLKAALAQLAAFQSGKKYQDMQEAHHKEVHSLKQKEKQTQEELARTRRDMVRTREHWFEVFEDLEKEYRNEIKKLEKQLKAALKRAWKAERPCDEALDKVTQQRQKIYELETEPEKERKNLHLRSQLNHDYENSSLPSSRTLQRKKITNNREKTGGKLRISKGMVSRRVRAFADRTEQERKETFLELLQLPVLHTDCSNARAGGKSAYVFVCAAPEGVFHTVKKGP